MNVRIHNTMMDDFADVHTPETYSGAYFDGKSSARRYVDVLIVGSHVSLLGESLSRRENGNELSVSTPARHGALLLKFKDGAVCELPPTQMLFNRLRMAGAEAPDLAMGAHVLSGDWRLVALVLAFLVGVIVAMYAWLIPAAAEILSPFVPDTMKKSVSTQALREMDRRWFEPTRLSVQTQAMIRDRFAQLQTDPKKPLAALELRATRKGDEGKPVIGPNALALPGGPIILTDEMVSLLKEDPDAISGVLAHEMGHVFFDHGTKGIVKALALTALGSALIGDYSSALAAAPVIVGQLKYTREAESQADAFSFQLLCSKKIDPARTAVLFDQALKNEAKDKKDSGVEAMIPEFLRSHPSHKDRAKFFKERCAAG